MGSSESGGDNTKGGVISFVAVTDTGDIRCPRCDSREIDSKGIEWGCRSCGRRWSKRLARFCPVCGQAIRYGWGG